VTRERKEREREGRLSDLDNSFPVLVVVAASLIHERNEEQHCSIRSVINFTVSHQFR
jgi:hypothetical protein